MPRLTVTVTDRQGDTFGAAMARRLNALLAADQAARRAAAKTATAVSRDTWNSRPNKRPVVQQRAGRESTGGQMASYVNWVPAQGGVRLDMQELDAKAPHWIIQEIGTGSRATIKQGGQANPVGRPGKGATHVRTVRSQRGRIIRGLVWAESGHYVPPGAGVGQNLYLASQVTGVPARRPNIRISREIQGQHFIKKGGEAGFRQYQSSVLAAARQAFRKSGRP